MKRKQSITTFLIAAFVAMALAPLATAGVPQLMNYQGRLTDAGGAPLDTTVSMVFTIYDDSTGGTAKWTETQPSVTVTGGTFNVLLGSINPISDTLFTNPELYLGIQIASNPEISPRTRLITTPYTFRAATVRGFSPGPNNVDSGLYTFVAGDSNTVLGDYGSICGGFGNTVQPTDLPDTIIDTTSFLGEAELDTNTLSSGGPPWPQCNDPIPLPWSGTVVGAYKSYAGSYSFVGQGAYNNDLAYLASFAGIVTGYCNKADGHFSFIGGGHHNWTNSTWTTTLYGQTIGGGAYNKADGQFSFIGGGAYNQNHGDFSTIGGGLDNETQMDRTTVGGGAYNTAYMWATTVGGGTDNTAGPIGSTVSGGGWNTTAGTGTGYYSAIGGGVYNEVQADYGTIAGGGWSTSGNSATSNAVYGDYGAIGGGGDNKMGMAGFPTTVTYATISGGGSNQVSASYGAIGGGGSNKVYDSYATIGGGFFNNDSAGYATVGGGYSNYVRFGGQYGTIGGGQYNDASGHHSTIGGGDTNVVKGDWGTIAGGDSNMVIDHRGTIGGGTKNLTEGVCATISGGYANVVRGLFSTIGGGDTNTVIGVSGTIAGGDTNTVESNYGTICGGLYNKVKDEYSFIGGGFWNHVLAGGKYATIGGGAQNTASGNYVTIGGGRRNRTLGDYATIGGGDTNTVEWNALWGTIGGGYGNEVHWDYGTIGGGDSNRVKAGGTWGTVGGGSRNEVTDSAGAILGGTRNVVNASWSCIGGGDTNWTTGCYATIPGGYLNVADGDYSFAAGQQAQALHDNSFVWNDGLAGAFASSAVNQFLIHADSGVGIRTYNPRAQLHIGGNNTDVGAFPVYQAPTNTNGIGTPVDEAALQGLLFNCYTRNADNFRRYGDIVALGYANTGTPAGGSVIRFLTNDSITATGIAVERMRIERNGFVGIGVTSPSEDLDVQGTARLRAMPPATGVNEVNVVVDNSGGATDGVLRKVVSSRRYKTNIRELNLDPDQVLGLQPVRFQWKASGAEDIGLIAEDVDQVIPELVVYDSDGRPDAVKYDRVAIYLLGTVKEQHSLIEELKTELSELSQKKTAEIESLKAQMSQMKALVETILAQQSGGSTKLAITK